MSRALIVGAVLAVAGCGSAHPEGTVSGRLTFQGQPVTGVEVNLFHKERGVGAAVRVDDAGAFAVKTPIPVGTYAVSVAPYPPPPGAKPAQGPQVPRRFTDPDTSPLTVSVKEGANEVTLSLD